MDHDLNRLINELCETSSEREWLEFKLNMANPERIGEYISALSNSACLHEAEEAFLIFGIEDKGHKIKGTTFDPFTEKGSGQENNEDLIPWLLQHLKPQIDFKVEIADHPKGRVVIFMIPPSIFGPVKFKNKSWIRIGSYNKPLSQYPEKEAVIWDRRRPFEEGIAKDKILESEALKLINYEKYFQLTGQNIPQNRKELINYLLQEGFYSRRVEG